LSFIRRVVNQLTDRNSSLLMVRWIFLRGLAVIVFLAFLSLYVQILGLIGSDGIIPIAPALDGANVSSNLQGFLKLPTITWWFNSDTALVALCWTGMIFSVLLFVDLVPKLVLFCLWLNYLSLFLAGRLFTSYQWDLLITEVLFASIFLAPFTVLPWDRRGGPPTLSVVLMKLILFKLMFLGGIAKLLSGDETWWNLTALNHHFVTQPLPTPLAWFFDKLPETLLAVGTLFTFLVELIAPFFVFVGGIIGTTAVGLIAALQVLILLTGNYGTFNLLALLLCLLCLNDRWLAVIGEWLHQLKQRLTTSDQNYWITWIKRGWTLPVLVLLFVLNGVVILGSVNIKPPLRPIDSLHNVLRPFRSVNAYGLFADMTTKRREIVIQGSRTGQNWESYRFSYKPGNPYGIPAIVAPHMPRLDWQMWFAALKPPNRVRWFPSFFKRLLQGSDPVLALMGKNPFPGDPPRYLRAVMYRYEFSSWSQLFRNGQWWTRDNRRLYFPPVALRNGRLRRAGGR
jgi:hypothetical protein